MIFGKQKSVRFEDRYRTEIRSTTPEYDFETGDEEGYQVQSINTKSPYQKPKETMVQKPKEGLVKNNRVTPSPKTMEDRMLAMEGKLDLLTENLAKLITMQGRRQGTSPSPTRTSRPPRGQCFECGEEGHYKNKCPKLTKSVSQLELEDNESLNEFGSEDEA
jgi:hypothetical protein